MAGFIAHSDSPRLRPGALPSPIFDWALSDLANGPFGKPGSPAFGSSVSTALAPGAETTANPALRRLAPRLYQRHGLRAIGHSSAAKIGSFTEHPLCSAWKVATRRGHPRAPSSS